MLPAKPVGPRISVPPRWCDRQKGFWYKSLYLIPCRKGSNLRRCRFGLNPYLHEVWKKHFGQ
jgi:hypothetical protein